MTRHDESDLWTVVLAWIAGLLLTGVVVRILLSPVVLAALGEAR